MKAYGLGTPGEFYKPKIYYILLMLGVLLFLFWAWIGTPSVAVKEMCMFYIFFGLTALSIVLFDNATKKSFDEIDTVTIEKPRFRFLTPKYQLIIGIMMSSVLAYRIITTQTAFIPYPQFQIFESQYINAFLTAIMGLVENWVFFVVLFPTIYKILHKNFEGAEIPAFAIASILIAFIFMGYHIFRYGAREDALISTFVFSFFNTIPMFLLRSSIVGDMLHMTNNFFAFLYSIQRIGVVFAI